MTTYAESLRRLDDFSNFEKKAHLLKPVFSLDGELGILKRLGGPHLQYPCVHVAGTVGKGTVCYLLHGALRAAGYRVGLYTSPHIRDIRERIRVNNRLITRNEFAAAYEAVIGRGRARPDTHTYFEALTAMTFLYFAEQKIDIAVIETGLGGRLDSTNVCAPVMSVITRIGHDHTAVLGRTLPQIAAEKAGIIKTGAPLVALWQHHSVNRVFEETSRKYNSQLHYALSKDISADFTDSYPDEFRNVAFYRENLSVAKKAVETLEGLGLDVAVKHLVAAARGMDFPARMQWQTMETPRGPRRLLVDAAHNPLAARALAAEIKNILNNKRLILVCAMMRDKDAAGFMRELAPLATAIISADLPLPRAWPAAELAKRAAKHCANIKTAPDITTALETAYKIANKNDIVCLTGSFYAIESLGS